MVVMVTLVMQHKLVKMVKFRSWSQTITTSNKSITIVVGLIHKTQLHQVQYLTFIQVHKTKRSVYMLFFLAGRVVLRLDLNLKNGS